MTQSQPPARGSTRIVELSQRIATNTTKLNDFLEANGLPTPTFDVDGPLGHSIPDDAAEIHAARAAIIDDTQELRRLVLGPKEYLMSYCVSDLLTTMCVHSQSCSSNSREHTCSTTISSPTKESPASVLHTASLSAARPPLPKSPSPQTCPSPTSSSFYASPPSRTSL